MPPRTKHKQFFSDTPLWFICRCQARYSIMRCVQPASVLRPRLWSPAGNVCRVLRSSSGVHRHFEKILFTVHFQICSCLCMPPEPTIMILLFTRSSGEPEAPKDGFSVQARNGFGSPAHSNKPPFDADKGVTIGIGSCGRNRSYTRIVRGLHIVYVTGSEFSSLLPLALLRAKGGRSAAKRDLWLQG